MYPPSPHLSTSLYHSMYLITAHFGIMFASCLYLAYVMYAACSYIFDLTRHMY
jgi:hypothetical protein